jgi:hypothetical protein
MAGCGASHPKPDGASAALARLSGTALPQRIVAISDRAGQAPTTCKVLPDPAVAGAYRLVVAWGQLGEDYVSVPRNIVLAKIGRGVSFDVFEVAAGKSIPVVAQADVTRASLSTAARTCRALADGQLQLVPGA